MVEPKSIHRTVNCSGCGCVLWNEHNIMHKIGEENPITKYALVICFPSYHNALFTYEKIITVLLGLIPIPCALPGERQSGEEVKLLNTQKQ